MWNFSSNVNVFQLQLLIYRLSLNFTEIYTIWTEGTKTKCRLFLNTRTEWTILTVLLAIFQWNYCFEMFKIGSDKLKYVWLSGMRIFVVITFNYWVIFFLILISIYFANHLFCNTMVEQLIQSTELYCPFSCNQSINWIDWRKRCVHPQNIKHSRSISMIYDKNQLPIEIRFHPFSILMNIYAKFMVNYIHLVRLFLCVRV